MVAHVKHAPLNPVDRVWVAGWHTRHADVIWNNEGLALLVYQRVDGVEPHSEKDTYEAGRTRGDEGEGWGKLRGVSHPC